MSAKLCFRFIHEWTHKDQLPCIWVWHGVALSWKSCRLWVRSVKIQVLPVLLSSCVPSIALFSRFPFVVVYRAGCLLVNKQTNCSRCIWVVQECGWPVAVYSIGCIGHFGVSNLEIALTQAAQHSQQREPEINQLCCPALVGTLRYSNTALENPL